MSSSLDKQDQTRDLENKCFEYGYLLAQSFDSADINKCLYTLLEQGIYSFFLIFNKIDTKKNTNQERKFTSLLMGYCESRFNLDFRNNHNDQEPNQGNHPKESENKYSWLVTINQSLSALIFSEDVLKRILIYARSSVVKNAS
jgi:ERCC4-related helicase